MSQNIQEILPKLRKYFVFLLNYFPAPKNYWLRNYIYYAVQYFPFWQNFEITIFVGILKNVGKFWKIQSSTFAKFMQNVCVKCWRNFRCSNTSTKLEDSFGVVQCTGNPPLLVKGDCHTGFLFLGSESLELICPSELICLDWIDIIFIINCKAIPSISRSTFGSILKNQLTKAHNTLQFILTMAAHTLSEMNKLRLEPCRE